MIPFTQPSIGPKEFAEVSECFDSGWFSSGKKVEKFEKACADFVGSRYAVAVSNGTVALDIAYKAVGIYTDDEVIVPALTYIATASMVSYQGAVPVFVDVDDTFNINPCLIEREISKKTKAISYIDCGGNPADFEKILEVAKRNGIITILDGAQSFGAKYDGKSTFCLPDVSTTSFHIAKPITTVEGGMIFTNDKAIFNRAKSIRSQGETSSRYNHVLLGTNGRMTDIQAGIGIAQLSGFGDSFRRRELLAEKYNRLLKNKRQSVLSNCKHGYSFYYILTEDRDGVVSLMNKDGIQARAVYPIPACDQPMWLHNKHRKGKYPFAKEITGRLVSLPFFPDMTDIQVEEVVDSLCRIQ